MRDCVAQQHLVGHEDQGDTDAAEELGEEKHRKVRLDGPAAGPTVQTPLLDRKTGNPHDPGSRERIGEEIERRCQE